MKPELQTWLIVIAAVGASGASVAAAIIAAWFGRGNANKLNVIHNLTNSNLTKVTVDLEIALRRIDELETHIKGIGKT